MKMKTIYMLLAVICLLAMITGCSSSATNTQTTGMEKAGQGNGKIAVNLNWGTTAKSTGKTVLSAPSGVATVRIIISWPGFVQPLQKDFIAASGSGAIDGVPAGSLRTLTAQGLDASGTVLYQGTAAYITVQAGQTTDAGTIAMMTNLMGSFRGSIVLGSPTYTSIQASIFSQDQGGKVYIAYGKSTGTYDKQTATSTLSTGQPLRLALDGLIPDTQYYYRLYFQPSGAGSFFPTGEFSFHTARPSGSTFTFTVQADSHLDENSDPDIYRQALANVLDDKPDFHVDLGDTFMCEKHSAPLTATVKAASDQATVVARYRYDRSYFANVARSAPLFLVNGNHEGEAGWLADGTANNIAIWTTLARQLYFLNPVPDSFYSGDSLEEAFVGKRASWYAWQWGDALFIVLDPFWYSKTQSSRDPWAMTLGDSQYSWLQSTLAASTAKFKFVFIHNMVGGLDGQMRGGIEAAPYFEWGGRNLDGTDVFSQKRPGWSKPIHQLLVQYGVTAVFHGHDHIYAKQNLDGIVYQEVPQPSALNSQSGSILATEYHYASGTILSSSGHMRVTVSPAKVTAQYVRAWLPKNETTQRKNGQVDDSWSIYAP